MVQLDASRPARSAQNAGPAVYGKFRQLEAAKIQGKVNALGQNKSMEPLLRLGPPAAGFLPMPSLLLFAARGSIYPGFQWHMNRKPRAMPCACQFFDVVCRGRISSAGSPQGHRRWEKEMLSGGSKRGIGVVQ